MILDIVHSTLFQNDDGTILTVYKGLFLKLILSDEIKDEYIQSNQ